MKGISLSRLFFCIPLIVALLFSFSGVAKASGVVTPTVADSWSDSNGLIHTFNGEAAYSNTISWLQATISIPDNPPNGLSAWVMAEAPDDSTWSQVGWDNGQLFTWSYNGTVHTYHFYGAVSGSITVAESCDFNTGTFREWLWWGRWYVLSTSTPGLVCGSYLKWSAETEITGKIVQTLPPSPPSVTFTNLLTNDLGASVFWPNIVTP